MFWRDILILFLAQYAVSDNVLQIIVHVLKTTEDKIKEKMNSSPLKVFENSLLLLFLINLFSFP